MDSARPVICDSVDVYLFRLGAELLNLCDGDVVPIVLLFMPVSSCGLRENSGFVGLFSLLNFGFLNNGLFTFYLVTFVIASQIPLFLS